MARATFLTLPRAAATPHCRGAARPDRRTRARRFCPRCALGLRPESFPAKKAASPGVVFSPAALAPRTTPDCQRAALVAQQDLLAERDAPHANPGGGRAAAGFPAAAAAVAAEVAAVAAVAAAAAAAAVAVAAAAVAAAAAAVVAGDVAAAEAAAPAVAAHSRRAEPLLGLRRQTIPPGSVWKSYAS